MDNQQYGLVCFDSDGNITDFNLHSVLVVEGVFTLGNQRAGWVPVDQLFPLRTQFRGVFMMPIVHSFSGAAPWEYVGAVYWDKGRLCWDITSNSQLSDIPWAGGAFAGRQFLYGYFN
ncbi:Uncharacterised protein [Neisseria animaloris]|uniref:hypothetical protein n=1 Tax=Neisseria animaloris TaxID=326522 RepID=UPI000A18BBF8|nr:hypothetical protein [Neisseria animaloris]OSI06789.1 hypothetical protein BWD08_10520 [Neisseria animaloris]VEH86569.1 Uncharacterised protein [Neisseria animaloris]